MNEKRELTHTDARGEVRMVDISGKSTSLREATASGRVRISDAAVQALRAATNKKGDVLATVRVAAIAAAKRTADLIPLCHHVALSACRLEIDDPLLDGSEYILQLRAHVTAKDATGVEMEALTAVSVAALTLYDMLKAVDRGIVIERIALETKRGGQRGPYERGQSLA